MENINKEEITRFIKSCNDLINGKYILVDVKITAILKAIAESTDIYNVLAECLINFDFNREYEKCKVSMTTDTSFKTPMEIHKIIPLVFCLLVEINRKNIDFDTFLSTQFPYADNQQERYNKFVSNIIVPFRDAVASLFDMSTDIDEQKEEGPVNILDKHVTVISTNMTPPIVLERTVLSSIEDPVETVKSEEESRLDKFFIDVVEKCNILEDKLMFVKNIAHRDNIDTILKAIKQTCEIKNITILNALVYALNNECGHDKVLKDTVSKLNDLYFEYLS